MSKQDKYTKAARGRDCMVRIPGVCNHNPETVVLAHYRLAGTCGMSVKPNNLQGAWACSACHDAIDGRTGASEIRDYRIYHAEGVFRTLDALISEGILRL